MLDYKKFPPIDKFEKVLLQMPQAAYLYAKMYCESDENRCLTVEKKNTRNLFRTSPTVFKNLCIELTENKCLEFDENDRYFIVELF